MALRTLTRIARSILPLALVALVQPALAQAPLIERAMQGEVGVGLGKRADWARPLCPGGKIEYTILIQNIGSVEAEAKIEDPIPPGTTYEKLSATHGADVNDANEIVWTGTLAPGKDHTISFRVIVDQGFPIGSDVVNQATGTMEADGVTAETQVQVESAVDCPLVPDVDKTASFAEPLACPGGEVTYEIRMTNPGDRGTTVDAFLEDPIPSGAVFGEILTAGAGYDPATNRVTWEGPIGPGSTETVRFTVFVDDTVAPGESFTNVATGTFTDAQEGDQAQAQDSATVTCPQPPDDGGDDGGGDDGSGDDGSGDDGGGDDGTGGDNEDAACPIEVIGFVEDSFGNSLDRYPLSNSTVWLFDIEDDTLPIAPLSEQEYEPLREQRTNKTFETNFEDHEFPDPERSGYEFDFTTQDVSRCPPRSVVVSALWDADDRFAVASSHLIDGRHVPIYLAHCISDVATEVMPEGPCFEWRLDKGTYVPWDPVEDHRASVDFTYSLLPFNDDSVRVIHDPTTDDPPLSESWDLGEVAPHQFFQDAAHLYFFSYKAMEYLHALGEEVGSSAEGELELAPALLEITPDAGRCAGACARPAASSFGRLTADAEAVRANTRISFHTTTASTVDRGKPDNREWHELGHYWMIQLYGGDWPGGYRHDRPACRTPRVLEMPGGEPFSSSGNHCGYLNDRSTDSYMEGFAELTSMLISHHYRDPRPALYRLAGNDVNLEVDHKVWGEFFGLRNEGAKDLFALKLLTPWREEFAVAGLLWDVFDDGSAEPKARGVASNEIRTEDRASLPAAEIFAHIVDDRPVTLAGLHGTLSSAFPDDTTGNGFSDVDEIFIAHGVFDDKTRNLTHDAGETLGTTGSSKLPDRPDRRAPEPIPNGFLEYELVANGAAEPRLELRYEFEPPFEYYDYETTARDTGKLHLHLPPDVYPARVEITAVGEGEDGELRSDPLVVTSDQYWSAIEAGAPSVGEHTFVLREQIPDIPDGPWLAAAELPGFEAKVRITPRGGEGIPGDAEDLCIVETLCVSGALAGRPEVFLKVIGPRPNGKLWTQISRFTPSEVEVWLRQMATDTTRYYRLGPVGAAGGDVSGLQDREAFDPAGAPATVPRGALLPGGDVVRVALPHPLEPGEPAPPEGIAWLTTPELPGFRFKARITAGDQVIGGQRVERCIVETLCIHGALAGRPEVFVKLIGPRPNGFLWVQAARFTPSQIELWSEQTATGTVRYYRLEAVGPRADDVSGLQDREAFTP